MTEVYYPLRSLREGHWFKLICGASFQHLPAVRNLTLAYTLAGADCIDVAADPAVIAAAQDALEVAGELGEEARARGFGFGHRPLLMVSLNDGEDPHFRKAEFNPELCPSNCPRPCEKICPARAIVFQKGSDLIERLDEKDASPQTPNGNLNPKSTFPGRSLETSQNPKSIEGFSGVIAQRCYGCGRCLPVCPLELIETHSFISAPEAIAQLIIEAGVDAIEIHTQVGHFAEFQRLWKAIAPWVNRLKLIAISCPDGEGLIDYLWALHELVTPLPCPLVWQTDGRPMSGDIGIGTTRAAVKLAQKVQRAGLPGYVQLAGGTNNHTVSKLQAAGLLNELGIGNGDKGENPCRQGGQGSDFSSPMPHAQPYVAGIAYGSYARVLLSPILEQLEKINEKAVDGNLAPIQSRPLGHLEEFPNLLWQAVAGAHSLVSQLKSAQKLPLPIPK